MPDAFPQALLPAGLRDILPDEAGFEADLVERLLDRLQAHGYRRVKPPLVEFEDTLLSGTGAAMARTTFRMMDPHSQRMMGLRADMTPQVARIAATRLAHEPRPLRLCYAGQVLRVQAGQLRPERQFGQIGVELIGSDSVAADVEVILLAAEGLHDIGVEALTVDVCAPPLAPALIATLGLDPGRASALHRALDRKDAAAIDALAGEHRGRLTALMQAVGTAGPALAALEAIDLPDSAAELRHRLAAVVAGVLDGSNGKLPVTVDAAEHRGFEFQAGICFTLFARGVRGELGRGGRYRAVDPAGGASEAATGFTLYSDSVLRAVQTPPPRDCLFLPAGTSHEDGRRLRDAGWITVAGLETVADDMAEARRMACSHVWLDGTAVPCDA